MDTYLLNIFFYFSLKNDAYIIHFGRKIWKYM